MIDYLYYYTAHVVRVIDGDTAILNIDQGLGTWRMNEKVRFYGINAPEMKGASKKEGQRSKKWVVDKIEGKTVVLKTHFDKEGKFGRLLGEIFLQEDDELVNLNAALVEEGLAVKYGKKK